MGRELMFGKAVEMAVEGISEYQLVRWSFLVTLP